MSQEDIMDRMATQISQITQSLDGTIAQLDALNRKIGDNNKSLMESLTAVNENMRLIIEVIKKQRSNTRETLDELKAEVHDEIDKLWKEKSLEGITKEQVEAVKKLKNINNAVSDNLYMAQLMAIIQSLREISGRAMAIKMQKEK